MAQGDVRISWPDGEARRSAGELWQEITASLHPLGRFDDEQMQNCTAQQGT
jgi:hypothetical protein